MRTSRAAWAACLGLLLLAQQQLAAPAAEAAAPPPLAAEASPLVCVVIRTYYAHGTYGNSALMNLLHSLKKQQHTRWVALLVVMDNRPFPDLRHIVRDAGDERIDVFAEWISAKYQPRTDDGKHWSDGYHTKLYNLTDMAVRACPRDSRWLMVTNGDNNYDPGFMSELVTHDDAEVVAFDYYSRFQRPTGTPCERFSAGPGLPPCKANGLAWCQTDLAANVYDWRRFVRDDMLFGLLDKGRGAGHDGLMAQVVVQRRWKVAHVRGRCLLEHAPSPQLCAAEGGVWDDTGAATDADAGGRCLEARRAGERLAALRAAGVAAEEVSVVVSHDPTTFGLSAPELQLRCMRLASPEAWAAMARYFPPQCRSPHDVVMEPAGAPVAAGQQLEQSAAGGVSLS